MLLDFMHNIKVSTSIGAEFWVVKPGPKLLWKMIFKRLTLEVVFVFKIYTGTASGFRFTSRNFIGHFTNFKSKFTSEHYREKNVCVNLLVDKAIHHAVKRLPKCKMESMLDWL